MVLGWSWDVSLVWTSSGRWCFMFWDQCRSCMNRYCTFACVRTHACASLPMSMSLHACLPDFVCVHPHFLKARLSPYSCEAADRSSRYGISAVCVSLVGGVGGWPDASLGRPLGWILTVLPAFLQLGSLEDMRSAEARTQGPVGGRARKARLRGSRRCHGVFTGKARGLQRTGSTP